MTLECWLSSACADLGLRAEIGFTMELPNNTRVRSVARIVGLGAPNGMLVFRHYDEVRPHIAGLSHAGFGFAVLDEPTSASEVDLDVAREMFSEWCWTGDESERPNWLKDPPDE